jgi:hypothetical protein
MTHPLWGTRPCFGQGRRRNFLTARGPDGASRDRAERKRDPKTNLGLFVRGYKDRMDDPRGRRQRGERPARRSVRRGSFAVGGGLIYAAAGRAPARAATSASVRNAARPTGTQTADPQTGRSAGSGAMRAATTRAAAS